MKGTDFTVKVAFANVNTHLQTTAQIKNSTELFKS